MSLFAGNGILRVTVDRNTEIDNGAQDRSRSFEMTTCPERTSGIRRELEGTSSSAPRTETEQRGLNSVMAHSHSCRNGNVGGVRIAVGSHVIVLVSGFLLHFMRRAPRKPLALCLDRRYECACSSPLAAVSVNVTQRARWDADYSSSGRRSVAQGLVT
jgi:hypothetical protein